MDKLPWMQFYTGDWLKDPKLSMCLPATRGIWIDAVAAMHENGHFGTLSGTPDQLIRILRCTETALMSAISDLQATGAADVTLRNAQGNAIITLVNRRMQREAKERQDNKLRQERYRNKGKHNGKNNGPITEMSQSEVYISLSSDSLFKSFYSSYPRKENPKKAKEAFIKAGITAEMMPELLEWLEKAKSSKQWQDPSAIPHAATWLNQERWKGDPPPLPAPKNGNGKSYTPDTVGKSNLEQPELHYFHCERCEDSGKIVAFFTNKSGENRFIAQMPLTKAQQFEPDKNQKSRTFRCNCEAGNRFSDLQPWEPA